jgi:hypothetical protein
MTGESRSDVWRSLKGRTFGPAALDYLLIGGGLSLLFTVAVVFVPGHGSFIGLDALPYFLLFSNAAHFAASTVRLYSKPGTYDSLPLLTMVFPLVALLLLTLSIADAGRLGRHLQSLYLTWSPYHYSAQAYGIAVMYSYRSGCALSPTNKKMLFWVSMLPFLYNFTTAPDVGLSWLVPASVLHQPTLAAFRIGLGLVLFVAAALAPVLLFVRVWRSSSGPLPLIAIMAVVANGVWFLVLGPLDAFVYATVFHGIQYMAIVIIFHVRDQMARPGNQHGRLYHGLWFYGASLVLGYALFNCLPLAYVFAGFGRVESMLLVVAAINIHHFVVDAYIWRLGRGDRNRAIVESNAPAPAPAPAPSVSPT